MTDLTVIIPTYNESKNIQNIIRSVTNIFITNNIDGEILIIDDDSPDNTSDLAVKMYKQGCPVNVIKRLTDDKGLSQSVVCGFQESISNKMIVIDADFSHPVNLIPLLYNNLDHYDIVIGSRYMKGGAIKKWPLKRRIISLGATFLGRCLFPEITDPVSGFFALKKNVIDNVQLESNGYKILLDILGKGKYKNWLEMPFEFIDRDSGDSKLNLSIINDYIYQVIDLVLYSIIIDGKNSYNQWKNIIYRLFHYD
jgi:dolichol-phosphate mannosyltransferase